MFCFDHGMCAQVHVCGKCMVIQMLVVFVNCEVYVKICDFILLYLFIRWFVSS